MTEEKTNFVDWYDPNNLLDVSEDDIRFMNEHTQSSYFIYYRCFDLVDKTYGLPHVKLEKPTDTFYGSSSYTPAMITKTENKHYMLSHKHNRFQFQHEIIEDFLGTIIRGMTFGINFSILQAWIENKFEIHEFEFIKNGNNPILYVNNVYEFEIGLTSEQVQNKFYKFST